MNERLAGPPANRKSSALLGFDQTPSQISGDACRAEPVQAAKEYHWFVAENELNMLNHEQSDLSILPRSVASVVRPNMRSFVKNAILATAPLQDLAAIGRYLEPIALRERMVLQEPKKKVDYVYFIESGLVSLRIVAAGGTFETAVIGHRGAVGASALLWGHVSTHQSVVLFPGTALRIRVGDLRRVMDECPNIQEQLSRFVEALNLHCAQTGFCGVWHNREKRLASWLCLASDAIDAHVLPVTHDYLSSVLGLPRPGITETFIQFTEQRLIRRMRGVLQIDDRDCLEQKACGCYRLIAGAYALMPRLSG
ncbi:Crp/Fnr family transcriptional regulator [Bradyrhizobium sp. USDA 336]|uniref:Crp/Fnr family transcriptional regulator n=1 Tax=Bradyrhizobium sp. USDA 336 TaxID=3156311 RepID=UPI0038341CC3